jgi:hypothetical protein
MLWKLVEDVYEYHFATNVWKKIFITKKTLKLELEKINS